MTGWLDDAVTEWGGRPVCRTAAEAVPRRRAVFSGEIRSVRHPTDSVRSLDALLDDGTGTITLRWVGRDDVPGITCGRCVTVEGTVLAQHGHLLLLNPLYRFSPWSSSTS